MIIKENNKNIEELKTLKGKLINLDVLDQENAFAFSLVLFDMLSIIDKLKTFDKEDKEIICSDEEAGEA